ncbi:MAG: hypothetical protein HFE34_01240, partial [Clostridia bacterium]|nr:hypothetical protein [Clostridia bacterium]
REVRSPLGCRLTDGNHTNLCGCDKLFYTSFRAKSRNLNRFAVILSRAKRSLRLLSLKMERTKKYLERIDE